VFVKFDVRSVFLLFHYQNYFNSNYEDVKPGLIKLGPSYIASVCRMRSLGYGRRAVY